MRSHSTRNQYALPVTCFKFYVMMAWWWSKGRNLCASNLNNKMLLFLAKNIYIYYLFSKRLAGCCAGVIEAPCCAELALSFLSNIACLSCTICPFITSRERCFPHFCSCFMELALSGDMTVEVAVCLCCRRKCLTFNFQIYECSGIKYVDTGKSDVISRGVAVR